MPATSQCKLTRFFIAWMVLGNLGVLILPAEGLTHLLGTPMLWTLLMPGLCLASLHPRRSMAVMLGLVCVPLVAMARLGRGRLARQSG